MERESGIFCPDPGSITAQQVVVHISCDARFLCAYFKSVFRCAMEAKFRSLPMGPCAGGFRVFPTPCRKLSRNVETEQNLILYDYLYDNSSSQAAWPVRTRRKKGGVDPALTDFSTCAANRVYQPRLLTATSFLHIPYCSARTYGVFEEWYNSNEKNSEIP